MKKTTAVIIALAIVALFLTGCASTKQSQKTTGAVVAEPEASELTTPREVRAGAPIMEIPADEYNEMYNSDSFVAVTCPDGRQGIEVILAHSWKDPCFVSE